MEEITAGFVYLRLHGKPETYASGYGAKTLAWTFDRQGEAEELDPSTL